VLRSDLGSDPSFTDFIGQLRTTVAEAFDYGEYPIVKLVEQFRRVRDQSHSPVFQAMFVFQQSRSVEQNDMGLVALGLECAHIGLGPLTLESIRIDQCVAQFDLSLAMAESQEVLAGTVEYNTDLFRADTIDRMIKQFVTLLDVVTAQPGIRLSDIPLAGSDEMTEVIVEFNNTKKPYPFEICLHELFESQVEQQPDAIALVFDGWRLLIKN